MRILQIIQKPQLRGAEIFACQLSIELQKLGHEVDVVYLFDHTAFDLNFNLNFIPLDASKRKRFSDFSAYKKLNRIIMEGEYDLVQANASDTLKYTAISKLIHKWKQPLVFRNANKIGDFIKSKPKYWLNKFFVNQVDHVISVSELCRLDFIKTLTFPSIKTDTIQIGVDLKPIGLLPKDLESVFLKGPVLINVGSLVPEKNHTGLLAIFAQVINNHPQAQLCIIGQGELKNKLLEQASKLNIERQVHLLGYRDDVLEIVNKASVFVMPSHIEGLPGVILEAQYCKTPVVAYDVGGISEIVNSDKTGWLIQHGDEEDFVKAIDKTISSYKDTVKRIKENAFKQVTTSFDNQTIAKRFLTVYKKVLSETVN